MIHLWYDVIRQGDPFAKDGRKIKLIRDQPPPADFADQNQSIEVNIGRHPDGLVVACRDRATNVRLMQASRAGASTPLPSNPFRSDEFSFVGQTNGYALALLAEPIGEEGKVGILSGSPTATEHGERIKGFKKAPADYPNVEVAYEQPDGDAFENACTAHRERCVRGHPNTEDFFGCNVSAPIGIARAVQNAGAAGALTLVDLRLCRTRRKMLTCGGSSKVWHGRAAIASLPPGIRVTDERSAERLLDG